MKTPATTEIMTSAPKQREFTAPGRLPLRQNTVAAGTAARKIVGTIKQAALYLMAATLVSACVEVVTAHATNCAEAYCDL